MHLHLSKTKWGEDTKSFHFGQFVVKKKHMHPSWLNQLWITSDPEIWTKIQLIIIKHQVQWSSTPIVNIILYLSTCFRNLPQILKWWQVLHHKMRYGINIQCEHEVIIDCTRGSFVDMEIKATFPVLNSRNRYIQLHFIFYYFFFSFFSGLKKGERQIRTSCVGTWGQPSQVWPWLSATTTLKSLWQFCFFFFGQSARRLLHRPKFHANCTQICFSFLVKSSHPILIEVKCWNIMLFWLFCLFTD